MKKGLLLIIAIAFIAFNANAQGTYTIYDLQYTTVAGDGTYPSLHVDEIGVETTGVVTAITGYSYYIQDGDGSWNGLFVYDDTNTPAIGDNITLTGTLVEYYGLTELKTITAYTLNSSGNTLPNAVTLVSSAVSDEQYEGVLVYVENAECTAAPDENGQWYVNTDLQIDDSMYDDALFTPVIGSIYNITGVVDYSYDEYGLHPRNLEDIDEVVSVDVLNNSLRIFPNPATSVLNVSSDSNIKNIAVSNVIGQRVMTINNVNANTYSIEMKSLAKGVYLLNLENADGTSNIIKFVKK